MIPAASSEYKIVLVGDSAVGNLPNIQENHHYSANMFTLYLTINYFPLLELTSNSNESISEKMK